MNMFLVTMVFIFLIQNSMETNEQTNAPDDSEATLTETDTELEGLSATRQRIRQLLTDYFAK
jgi:TorA maturation chaperone TorD